MTHALVHLEAKWARLVRRFFHAVRSHLLSCSSPNGRYRQLKVNLSAPNPTVAGDIPKVDTGHASVRTDVEAVDSDLLSLKVSLLGDCDIGKTSFMMKYVGDVEEQRGVEMAGLNLMDKIFVAKGARIAFRLWDVGAMKATLFFSSSTHNINVNKIFKFIVAKLFKLPWTVERNLTIGEPIIDY
ncbi:hypothetical protein B296_00044798 [Ensete ventricosum]|uniref:Uncharacterized protein n=1 Tax=Ensete ventricosum TaxID=4639 RepID=A0A426X5D9_ENSVE|nr:hypothetical protein B296_00044798 [Ensete ventricosum]